MSKRSKVKIILSLKGVVNTICEKVVFLDQPAGHPSHHWAVHPKPKNRFDQEQKKFSLFFFLEKNWPWAIPPWLVQ